ncbi:MAG: glycosyltransferase family 2 protein [Lachnospiraceae bacterium]|nr:glycosyltransferase family 2 protein [Lachnospiraceae bacterium]
MIIQRLLLPDETTENEAELYLRGNYKIKDGIIKLKKDDAVSLSTYFNCFSYAKWEHYTDVKNVGLRILSAGDLEVRAYVAAGDFKDAPNPELRNRIVQEPLPAKVKEITSLRTEINSEEGKKKTETLIKIPKIKEKAQILYFDFIARSEKAKIISAEYITEEKPKNNVNLAICICTFKREAEVKRNVAAINALCRENKESEAFGKIDIYVSDNGNTLKAEDLPGAFMFPNKNTGGSGGFTRGMIESMIYHGGYSHAILMDDDISLDARIIEKLYAFLSYIKSKFSESLVGGNYFSLQRPYIQMIGNENIKRHGLFEVNTFYGNFDMRELSAVAANEVRRKGRAANYNGWWFCCIPASYIRPDNLPMPMFLHYDDIEYGFRKTDRAVITMNGIGVKHPEFAGKQPASTQYYDVRNWLIAETASRKGLTKLKILKDITDRVACETTRYRYEATHLALDGLECFLNGPEEFMKIDPVELHKSLMARNYTFVSPEEAGVEIPKEVKNLTFWEVTPKMYFLDALCWLLPSKDETLVAFKRDVDLPMRSRRLFFYNEDINVGFMSEKDYKKAIGCLTRYIKLAFRILTEYDGVKKEWREKKPAYTGLAFWERYLGIK